MDAEFFMLVALLITESQRTFPSRKVMRGAGARLTVIMGQEIPLGLAQLRSEGKDVSADGIELQAAEALLAAVRARAMAGPPAAA